MQDIVYNLWLDQIFIGQRAEEIGLQTRVRGRPDGAVLYCEYLVILVKIWCEFVYFNPLTINMFLKTSNPLLTMPQQWHFGAHTVAVWGTFKLMERVES